MIDDFARFAKGIPAAQGLVRWRISKITDHQRALNLSPLPCAIDDPTNISLQTSKRIIANLTG
jgi:hypothetical protein